MPMAGILPAFVGDWGDQARNVPPSAPLVDPEPFIIPADVGVLPAGYDWSRVQYVELNMNTTGFGHQISLGYRIADDFVIPTGETWQLTSVTFQVYQSWTSTFCTINDIRIWIYDDDPAVGNLVWGDADTNRFESGVFSGIYRGSDKPDYVPLQLMQRPIMAVRCAVDVELSEGTYWIAWSSGGTAPSGPWAVPIVIDGEAVTGNGRQEVDGIWRDAQDSVVGTQQGFPLLIEGTKLGTGTGGPGETIFIDSFMAVLDDDPIVELTDDTLDVVLDEEVIGDAEEDGIVGVVEDDVDVDLECS
jgi:hypothetical protein